MFRLPFVIVLATAVAVVPTPARAQPVLFFDDFSGPSLNPAFQTALPPAGTGDGPGNLAYLGAPNYSFQNHAGASVIRLTNLLSDRQRVGWSTSTVFSVPEFRLEMRFNTLTVSAATSIDNLIEGWIIDGGNLNRYDFAMTVAPGFGTGREFRSGGTIDSSYLVQGFPFVNNTWYRFVLSGAANENIRASVFADDGITEIVGRFFSHSAGAFPSGFRLGLSQAMGLPGGTFPVDVAIDYMRLTTVPEPTSLLLLAIASGAIGYFRVRGSRNRTKFIDQQRDTERFA